MRKLLHQLQPDFDAELNELPLSKLQSLGVKVLAFDLDNTLTFKRTRQLDTETLKYITQLNASGFKLMLASNAMSDITELGVMMNATIVPAGFWTRKPMKRYFQRLITLSGCESDEIAMIGDRIFTDILGANLAGLTSIKIHRAK